MKKVKFALASLFCLSLCAIFVGEISAQVAPTISTPWSWPVVSDFGPRAVVVGSPFHQGIDYSPGNGDNDYGTPIPAVETGVVNSICNNKDFYEIIVKGENSGQNWLYGHIFSNKAPNLDNNIKFAAERGSTRLWTLGGFIGVSLGSLGSNLHC